MAQRPPSSCSARPRSPGTAVWFLPAAALLLVVLLRWPAMGSYPPVSPRGSGSVPARRAELYSKMARDLDERGAAFLRGGETSQSLTLTDLFDTGDDGAVVPRLKAADPPVRANVLHLDPEFATVISKAVKEVESGTDPAEIRSRLREALPRAPQKQLYDPVLLHTSFARILGHPKLPEEQSAPSFDHVKFFHGLVAQVNEKLHGFQATVSELWYVEEYDVLALALNGKMKVQRLHLGCNHQGNENS